MPTVEMRLKLMALKAALTEEQSIPDVEFALGLVAHLLTLTQEAFSYVDRMMEIVDSLPQSFQGKETLKLQLSRYLFSPPNMQKAIEDRVTASLVARLPEPEKKAKVKSFVEVSGQPYDFPEGMGPND